MQHESPLIELGDGHAFAIGVGGVHVAGTDYDDFLGDGGETTGFRTEADAGGRLRGNADLVRDVCEPLLERA